MPENEVVEQVDETVLTETPVQDETIVETPDVEESVEVKGDTEPVAVEDTATDEPGFDDDLLNRAEQYGFTDEQIEVYESPAALEAAMVAQDRRFAQMGKSIAQNQATTQQPVQPAQPSAAPQSTPQVQAPPDPSTSGQVLDLSKYKDALDEEAFAALQDVATHLSSKVEGISQQYQEVVGQLTQQQQASANANYQRELDHVISSFGDEWKETFGSKPTSQLDVVVKLDVQGNIESVTGADKDLFLSRQKLAVEINALALGYSQSGVRVDGMELGKRALRVAFGNDQNKMDRAAFRKKLNAKARGATKRPTQRDVGESMSSEQKESALIANLDARIAKKISSAQTPKRKAADPK